ncbi:NUDIX domain-containing protein [Thalassolituus sp. C2-1]|uniref:NUDIX domain-containing protein n=1 Tax=Venatorbacter sp. C2-1 TaxID=2597518 RepID=UPI001FB930BF|nr:NUDIX domain-containing protein [Thalassolituus sp. C2-1]
MAFDRNDVEVAARDVAFNGFFRIEKIRLRHRMFTGGWSGYFERELFERGEAVCVLLFDPQRDCVVLTEQFRIGALADEHSPWLLELVAGMVEPGESYAEVARRETEEEAGCSFNELLPICNYWVSPGGTSERVQLYCALIDSEGVGGIHGLADENEDIRLARMSFSEAYAAVENGRINNAATIMALQWLHIHHLQLLQKK